MVKKGGKKENNFIKWIVVGLLILAVLFLAYKVFTGQVVSGTGNLSVILNLNSSNPSFLVNFSGRSYLVSLVYSKSTGIGTLTNVSGTYVTVFQTTGAFITVNVSGTNVTRLIYLSNSTTINGLTVALINATYKVAAGQIGYIPFSSALIRVSEATCNSLATTINASTSKMINGLNVSLVSANLSGNLISASLKVIGNNFILTNDVSSASVLSNKKIIIIGTREYSIELISASNTQATIKVTSCFSPITSINQTSTTNQTSNITTCKSSFQSCSLTSNCCSGLTCQNGLCKTLTISSCTPKTCSQLGKQCGSVNNGCNSTLNCGTCSGGKICTGGHCLGNYGSYCTSGSQCATGRCKPSFRFLWYRTGNYCY